jgi:hypothetical protein
VGLATFKVSKDLKYLHLDFTQVSDAGLAHFKVCKELRMLGLTGTRVSDEGVAPFKDCKNLKFLTLQKTKVTAAKVEDLGKALPGCFIAWDPPDTGR